jgi:hypothetical protein
MAIEHAQTADVLESIRGEISILSIKALLGAYFESTSVAWFPASSGTFQ